MEREVLLDRLEMFNLNKGRYNQLLSKGDKLLMILIKNIMLYLLV